MNKFHYRISKNLAGSGGWSVRYFKGDENMGGGLYPAPEPYEYVVAAWWDSIDEATRQLWLDRTGGDSPKNAFCAFVLARAHDQAVQDAEAWLRRHSLSASQPPV